MFSPLQTIKALAQKLTGKVGSGSVSIVSADSIRPVRVGTSAILESYNDLPWVRAVCDRVGHGVAGLVWRVYVLKRNGKSFRSKALQNSYGVPRQRMLKRFNSARELQEIIDHPLIDLLTSFNPVLGAVGSLRVVQTNIDLAGEGFLLKERDGRGNVVGLWPCPATWVKETPSDENHDSFLISQGQFTDYLPAKDVIWVKNPDPVRPYGRGSGIGRSLADELETDEHAAKHTGSWFRNRARPDFIIIMKDSQDPNEAKRLEQRLTEHNRGFMKAFKPVVLNREVDVKELNQTFEDMELVSLRKFERDIIRQVWGIPPEVMGIIENSNRATIAAAEFIFAKLSVTPRANLLCSALQSQLVPDFDANIILDFESPVEEDREFALKVLTAAPWSHKVDEWRELAGTAPLVGDEGQVFMVPPTWSPRATLEDALDMPEEPEEGTPEPEEGTPEPEEGDDSGGTGPAPEKMLKAMLPSEVPNVLVDMTDRGVQSKLWQLTYQQIADIVEAFGTEWVAQAGDNIQWQMSREVARFLDEYAGERIRDINNTTLDDLRKTLVEGVVAGETLDQLTDRVKQVFHEASRNRARTIATTETVRAVNFGALEGMRQGGFKEKEWLSTGDDHVRDTHRYLDGKRAPLEGFFTSSSGAKAKHPGGFKKASEDINCRCTIIAVTSDKADRSAMWKSIDDRRARYAKIYESTVKRIFMAQKHLVINRLKEYYQ